MALMITFRDPTRIAKEDGIEKSPESLSAPEPVGNDEI
jgi:hypothetical protein